MKRQTLFRLLKAVCFCALLGLCLSVATRLTQRKASINRMGPLLENPTAYDVIFTGNSHMVNSVLPQELWREYGIAAYNAASYGNMMPMTYWTSTILFDHYATPKLLVVDVKDVGSDAKLTGSSADAHTALDCFPLTLTKARAIKDLMSDPNLTDDEGNAYRDIRFEYYFPLAKYHSRWSALGSGDFHPRHTRERGGELAIGVATPRDYDITDSSGDEYGVGFQYLRRLIEECQARGVEVLLTHLPYPATDEEQVVANTVRYIADDYGVNYIDFVSLDQVVDYDTDCFDFNSHQNASGAQKITDYLGRYIRDHYDLPDHSGDADWAAGYDAYYDEKLDNLRSQRNPVNALLLLHDSSLSAVVALPGGSALYADEKLMLLLHNAAREHIYEEDAYAKWSSALFPLDTLEDAAWEGEACLIVLDRGSGEVTQAPGDAASVSASFGSLALTTEDGARTLTLTREGKTVYEQTDAPCPDLRILVIDERTGDVAASLSYDL